MSTTANHTTQNDDTPKQPSEQPRRRRWLLAGGASLAMGGVMALAKVFFMVPLPVDMLFNFTGRLLGVPWIFNMVHALPFGLDQYAKYALYAVTVVILLGFWTVLGAFYTRFSRWLTRWGTDAAYVVLSVLLTGLVLLPIQGLGLFGLSPNNFQYPPLASALWSAGFGLVFAAALHLLYATSIKRSDSDSSGFSASRRESLRSIAGIVVVLSGLAAFGRMVGDGVARAAQSITDLIDRIRGISSEVTAVGDHYNVSKNVFDPSVNASNWQLRITGMVDNEITLNLDDLRAMESVERPNTLMCVSNRVGGNLIGNSVWTGVRLSELLNQAGVQEGANELILRAADNYADSFPLDAAMRDATIVAYLQNGEPLTQSHGFPARVLVPGIYGMKNVKWVLEIELTNQDYQGYWQTRGWSDTAIVKTLSRIDTAEATQLEDGSYAIGGIAYAGLRGVQGVEVSVDDGESWQGAQLKPALNDLSWNLWGFTWSPEPGNYQVLVRATDGTGSVQTAEQSPPLPDGASGYHRLRVRVG